MSRNAARSAARTGAVQALYQMEIAGTDVTDVINEFQSDRFPNADKDDLIANADPAFFAETLTGILSRQRELDPIIDRQLASGWRLSRLDSTLRAILRAGTYELVARSDIPARVIINEYVDIAHTFFESQEPRVVNGVLDKVAHLARDGELAKTPGSESRAPASDVGKTIPDDDS